MVGTFSPRRQKQSGTQKSIGILLIVISVALFFTTFIPFLKIIGQFLVGSFGVSIYLILASIFLAGLALIMKAKYKFSIKYIIYNAIVIFAIIGILHLAFTTSSFKAGFSAYINKMYISWTPGGAIWGTLSYGLQKIISVAGAYVFYIILATIFIALIIDYRHAYKQFLRIKQKNVDLQKTNTTLTQGEIKFRKPEATDVKVKATSLENEPTLITLNNKQRQRELSKEELGRRLEGNLTADSNEINNFDSLSLESSLNDDKDALKRILGLKQSSNDSKHAEEMTAEMLKQYMRAPKTVTLAPTIEQQKQFLHATNAAGNYSEIIGRDNKATDSLFMPKQTPSLNETINTAFNDLSAPSLDNRPAKVFDNSIKPIINGDIELQNKTNFLNNIENKPSNNFASDFLNSRRRDRIDNPIINNANPLNENTTIDNLFADLEIKTGKSQEPLNNLVEEKTPLNSIDDIINQIKKENSNIVSSKYSENEDEISDNNSNVEDANDEIHKECNNESAKEEHENYNEVETTQNEIRTGGETDDSGFIPDEEYSETGDSEFEFNNQDDQKEESELVSNFKKNFMDKVQQQPKQQSIFEMDVEETEKSEPNFGVDVNYNYVRPGLDLLKDYAANKLSDEDEEYYREKAHVLEETLANFNVPVRVVAFTRGPAVTRYELQMAPGVSVKKIQAHESDIAMSLESNGNIRIEAPIPGKNAVGIEIPNRKIETIGLKEVISTPEFAASNQLSFGLGKDISGETMLCNIDEMPHLLVAGSTGSGKSVCLNAMLASLLFKHSPADLKIILIDPKRVEFGLYSGIPHLITPEPVTEPKEAINALKWAVEEMDRRYQLFHECKVNKIADYNRRSEVKNGEDKKLPNIIIVIDELANLISLAKRDVEEYIKRLTSLARASGIYLVVATQRPSVDVITGTIKVNIPSRIAFMVTSGGDSKTILDQYGAENLLGKGDMLYAPQNFSEPKRVQCSFISSDEVRAIVEFIKANNEAYFDEELTKAVLKKDEQTIINSSEDAQELESVRNKFDVLLPDALRLAIENRTASISMIQRRFAVGYSRAARIIDQMELAKFISPSDGSKSRSVYLTMEEYNELFDNKN